jgi:hypothetical protein
VLLAGFEGWHTTVTDDPLLGRLLAERGVDAQVRAWTDPAVDWNAADLVWVRSTWDYTFRFAEWLGWLGLLARRRGRVENDPVLLAWNSNKGYLADLAAAGLPTVPTTYVAPGEPPPSLTGEVVVKPSVSAGGRDTGRFGPDHHAAARALVASIGASGRWAMVQPFLSSVEHRGETAVVVVDGRVSHVLRKRSVLAPDEVAPLRPDALGAAEAMYDPHLVRADPGGATAAELDVVGRTLAFLRARFGTPPLQMRVDLLTGPDGKPALLELEAVEPHLYLDEAGPGAADRLVDAALRRLGATAQ